MAAGCGSQETAEVERADGADSAETQPQELEALEAPVRPLVRTDSAEESEVVTNRPIWIEGGTFVMGTDDSYPALGPAHTVTVSSFWMQEHEVTNAELRQFDPTHRSVSGRDSYPAQYVLWDEAVAYAEHLGGSLPTEAQWEYAARGREGRPYPWGDALPTCELAHYVGCEPGGPLPVMSLPAGATPEGVHDLAGNMLEWVFDRYGDYEADSAVDPTGPEIDTTPYGDLRVLRGGAYGFDTTLVSGVGRTSWARSIARPSEVLEMGFIGFRVVWPGDAGPDSPPPAR